MNTSDTVSSADIVRNFGAWQDRALQAPVIVTNRGRPKYVLLSFDAWNGGHRGAPVPAHPALQAEYKALIERMSGGFIVVDEDLSVREASTAAAILIGRPADALVGLPIAAIMDDLGIGVALVDLRRVLASGHEARFDLPLAGGLGKRISGHAYPWVNGIAVSLHPYVEAREDIWLSEQRALERARAEHAGVFVLRLSVRGTVAAADDRTIALLGVQRDRIMNARLVDLLAMSARATARDAVEAILSGQADARAFDSAILTNRGEERRVTLSIAPIADGFAVGGAMVMFTLAPAVPDTTNPTSAQPA